MTLLGTMATPSSLVCTKCGQVNDSSARRCMKCNAHLHLVCRKCNEVNERAAHNCVACGTRLHRSLFTRLKSQLRHHFTPMEIALIILGLVALILVVVKVTRQNSNPPAGSSAGSVDEPSIQY
jgi:ribosomal protein L40E